MVLLAPIKPSMSDDFNEEEGTAVFKRPSSSSKPNQPKAELMNPSCPRHDAQSGIHNSNGQNSSAQNGEVSPCAKPTYMMSPAGNSIKLPLVSPKASTSSAKL